MKFRLKYVSVVFAVLSFFSFHAQQKKVDSVLAVINNSKTDSVRLKLYFDLLEACDIKDNLKYTNEALRFADEILAKKPSENFRKKIIQDKIRYLYYLVPYYETTEGLASSKLVECHKAAQNLFREINDTSGILSTYLHLSYDYENQGKAFQTLEVLQEALALAERTGRSEEISKFTIAIAFLFAGQKDIQHGIEYLEKGMKIELSSADSNRMAEAHIMSGNFYTSIGDWPRAIDGYKRAIPHFVRNKNYQRLQSIYIDIGVCYLMMKEADMALSNIDSCLALLEKKNSPRMMAKALMAKGDVFTAKGEIEKAIEIHLQALSIGEKEDINWFWTYISDLCSKLADEHLMLKKNKEAKIFGDRALALSSRFNNVGYVMAAERTMSKVDSAGGNFESAYSHYQKYIVLKNKLNSEEVRKAAAREKFNMELAKQKTEQALKAEASRKEIEKQKMVRNAFIAGFILILGFAGFVFRSYRIKKKLNEELADKNHEIEEKNKDIMDSIRYARRIQSSLMPNQKYLDKHLGRGPRP